MGQPSIYDDEGQSYFVRRLIDNDMEASEWLPGPKERRRIRRMSSPQPRHYAKKGGNWRLRRAVFIRDQFRCRDCLRDFSHLLKMDPSVYKGEPVEGLTLGHIIPKSKEGPMTVGNLIAQCGPCNVRLGDRLWVEGWQDLPEYKFKTRWRKEREQDPRKIRADEAWAESVIEARLPLWMQQRDDHEKKAEQ